MHTLFEQVGGRKKEDFITQGRFLRKMRKGELRASE